MKKNKLAHIALSDDGFLFDASSGNTFTLNSTGTFILKKLIAGIESNEIIAVMTKRYDTTEDIVSRDIAQFHQLLAELDILESLGTES